MSDQTEHDAVAAEATRASVMETVRSQAETTIEQLQRDVFRLLEEAHQPFAAPHVTDPPLQSEPKPAQHAGEEEPVRRHIDPELRQSIIEIIRAEIAALDVAALVKTEIDTQLRAVTKLLQERLKGSQQPKLQKLAPMLSRRRR